MVTIVLQIVQVVLSVILIVTILLQQKGSGLDAGLGGSGTILMTKRGVDLFLYKTTIATSILFFATALAQILI